MILRTTCLAILLATPSLALTIDQFEGRWRGEGVMLLDDEPEQRFRCQIRLRPIRQGETFFSGRCATAQAAQSFTYMVFEDAGGAVRAENRAVNRDDLPLLMVGTAAEGLLSFTAEDNALFELRLDGDALEFRIEGEGNQGFASGTALLNRSD